MKVGIIGAMEEEISWLRSQMDHPTLSTNTGKIQFTLGNLWGNETVVVTCGIGKVNMAICAQMLIDFEIDVIINVGVAGSLDPKLNIGDIVIATETQQYDIDVSALGDPVGTIPRMDTSIFTCDADLVDKALKACNNCLTNVNYHTGKILTGDKFIASPQEKDYLHQHFKGTCVEMEGGALGQTSYINNIPFVIIRAISDKADGSSHLDYPIFEKEAIEHTNALIKELYTLL